MCGIVLVKAQATTQKGIAMRLLMIAVFLLSANAGMAFGEGRYTVVAGTHYGLELEGVFVLDTKTGKVKFCYGLSEIKCTDYSKK